MCTDPAAGVPCDDACCLGDAPVPGDAELVTELLLSPTFPPPLSEPAPGDEPDAAWRSLLSSDAARAMRAGAATLWMVAASPSPPADTAPDCDELNVSGVAEDVGVDAMAMRDLQGGRRYPIPASLYG